MLVVGISVPRKDIALAIERATLFSVWLSAKSQGDSDPLTIHQATLCAGQSVLFFITPREQRYRLPDHRSIGESTYL